MNNAAIERDYRVKGNGKQYDKLKTELAALGLELDCSYNKWYNVFDKKGMNVRYDVFDSLADVKEWLKTDYENWKLNGREY